MRGREGGAEGREQGRRNSGARRGRAEQLNGALGQWRRGGAAQRSAAVWSRAGRGVSVGASPGSSGARRGGAELLNGVRGQRRRGEAKGGREARASSGGMPWRREGGAAVEERQRRRGPTAKQRRREGGLICGAYRHVSEATVKTSQGGDLPDFRN